MKGKGEDRPETEVRRALDLLDRYPRQTASPWLADRVLAGLKSAPETRSVAAWQLALASLLLVVNGLAFYFWAANSPASDDPVYALGAEYGLAMPDDGHDAYQIPSTEDY